MKKFLLLLLLFFLAFYLIKAFSRLLKLFVQKDDNSKRNNDAPQFENVDNNNIKRKKFEKDEGEYIDYEEVK